MCNTCLKITSKVRQKLGIELPYPLAGHIVVTMQRSCVLSGGAPTTAATSVFTKHNWDMEMGHLWLNGLGIYDLMGGAFIT